VIREPKHPYTQLLISSIPVADRRRRWGDEASTESEAAPAAAAHLGCPFAPRCPAVMDVCRDQVPPLFTPDRARAAACHLYHDAPVLASADITAVFGRTEPSLTR
jgi:peptide/nickel transport system ATP-binding protein